MTPPLIDCFLAWAISSYYLTVIIDHRVAGDDGGKTEDLGSRLSASLVALTPSFGGSPAEPMEIMWEQLQQECTLGQHVGVQLETWILTKSAGVWLKVPGLGHILLVQWISGEILPPFWYKAHFCSSKIDGVRAFFRKSLKNVTIICQRFTSTYN